MKMIKQQELLQLRKTYFPGARVILEKMNDPYGNLISGDLGSVISVDDIGTIHVAWDKGGSLGVVFGEDKCSIIKVK